MNDEQTPALREAVENMRNMRESYDQIGAAAEAYNTGKVQLAENITAKGVQASATETLPELAEKVAHIAHEYVMIDGGEQYETQLFGSTTAASPIWNLYDVLAQMKNTYLDSPYKGIIVCEFYRGYNSLQLQGADAYYTCDGDFYDYDALHEWHDFDNGKANRWVCFMWQSETPNFVISDTAISPRAMYVGGYIDKISYLVNGRLVELVCGVEERDKIGQFINYNSGTFYTNPWQRVTIINSIEKVLNRVPFDNNAVVEVAVLKGTKEIESAINDTMFGAMTAARAIYAPDVEVLFSRQTSVAPQMFRNSNNLEIIDLSSLKSISNPYGTTYKRPDFWLAGKARLCDVIVGEMNESFSAGGNGQGYWNPTSILSSATAKAQLIENIKNHILARVSDRTGLSQLTFTVSTNMFNAISGETITWNDEEMTLADAFLTKNWLLAGA